MGLIFNRKKQVEQPAPDLGRANLAKQVRASTVTIERHATSAAPEQQAQPAQLVSTLPDPADQGAPIYQFTTSSDPTSRSRAWFITMGVFFSAVVAVNIVLGFYMSAVVIVLLAALVFTNATRKRKELKVGFFAGGLRLNEEFIPWHELTKFWILYEPPALKRLHFQRRSKLFGELWLDLAGENPLKIRDMLLPLLPEDPSKEESRVDLVTRTFKL